ncbi:MAG: NUDIX hydrolase [Bacteroidota bacterium]
MPDEKNPWISHSEKKIYSNPWIALTEHHVTNPGGGKSLYGKVHFKNYAIGIIALDEDQNTWLVGQHRFPLDAYSWEIPMGGGPLSESPIASAKRELREETGITAKHWMELGKIHLSNSVTDEVGIAFLAEGLEYGEPEFEETEDLAIKKIPFQEAISMCDKNQITDSLSVAAIYKLARVLQL